jgi:phage shock protein PspC (stress-responsive transcriptional regulator)
MYDDRYDDPNLTSYARAEAGLPAPRLWRSRGNRVLAGVLGGLAEKFGLEPRPLRILYALCTALTGGLLAIPYFAIWAITRPHGASRATPRLWRSSSDKVIAGVLGGVAEKFDVPATLLRVVFTVLTVFSAGFPGVLLYLVLWMMMGSPEELREREGYRY